jgi:hypothetical protein
MALLNRQSLKNYFKKGNAPTEQHFIDLIESSINIVDDGIARGADQGYRISPIGNSNRLISFFRNMQKRDPDWFISLNENDIPGIAFQEQGKGPRLVLKEGGQVGIGVNNPKYTLEVKGTVGFTNRVGTLYQGKVPGDGKWHDMVSGLREPSAFEVMAIINGRKGSGKYALAHAIALNTFGGKLSFGGIKKTSACYGSFFNRLRFRWTGELYDYSLQVKTASPYGIDEQNGEPFPIQFQITGLLENR